MEASEVDYIEVRSPRTGQIEKRIAACTAQELATRCEALRREQPAWAALGVEGRADVMRRWADAIEQHAGDIAAAEEADTGRRRVAHEVPYMVSAAVRGWADQAPAVLMHARLQGVSSVSPWVVFDTEFDPYPLVGAITPWNHPFLLSTLDPIPALLAGCAVVVKPSEVTPRFVQPVLRSLEEVPEVAAVFTYVIGGPQTGRGLTDAVDALCFTGSVRTGRSIAVRCAERFIPAFLELGGKDAAIVTASADAERAAALVLKGAVHNTGQLCFSTERVYVADEVHDEFVAALVSAASEMRPNHPDISHGHLGPFILRRQADVVDDHLADAVAGGATVMCGGPTRSLDGGRYMDATVLTGVTHEMRIMREETFGPVIPVMRYSTIDEAIALANDSEFGLSGAVIAGSDEEAREIGGRMHAGAISLQDTSLTINIMRDVEKTSYAQSGLGGSRMGPNALLRFLRRKALITQRGEPLGMDALSEDLFVPKARV